jgi:hypothetical protein
MSITAKISYPDFFLVGEEFKIIILIDFSNKKIVIVS